MDTIASLETKVCFFIIDAGEIVNPSIIPLLKSIQISSITPIYLTIFFIKSLS